MNNLLLLSVLLITIIVVLVITKEQFGDIIGTIAGGPTQLISVLDPTGAKFTPFGIIYRTPALYFSASSITVPNTTRFYDYPLLYLFDASQITPSALTASYFNTGGAGSSTYLRPPVSALINAVPISSTGQYNGPSTLPPSGSYFPNIISISTLFPNSGSPAFTTPASNTNPTVTQITTSLTAAGMASGTITNSDSAVAGAQDNGNLVATNQWMAWIVSPTVIQAPLTVGRNYVLGIAAQLNINSISGTTIIPRRYGEFKYVDVVMSIENGLVEARPGGVSSAGISFGTLTI